MYLETSESCSRVCAQSYCLLEWTVLQGEPKALPGEHQLMLDGLAAAKMDVSGRCGRAEERAHVRSALGQDLFWGDSCLVRPDFSVDIVCRHFFSRGFHCRNAQKVLHEKFLENPLRLTTYLTHFCRLAVATHVQGGTGKETTDPRMTRSDDPFALQLHALLHSACVSIFKLMLVVHIEVATFFDCPCGMPDQGNNRAHVCVCVHLNVCGHVCASECVCMRAHTRVCI